ncbi:MAG: CAP domain-containing protein [Planctomycetota bacterium]
MRKGGHFAKPQRARKDLLAELEMRRAAALELIYDEKRYPYPYAANQAEIQAEVDGLVGRVREIWDRPEEALLALDPDWSAQRASLVGLEDRLRALGEECAAVEALDLELREAIALDRQGWSAADLRRIEETAVFNAEIKSSITDDERECHRLTNAYRMMMGLPPVKIDEALVLAARGHSQEMKDLGYFAHDSPVPGRERPSDRAALAGWGGGVSGEHRARTAERGRGRGGLDLELRAPPQHPRSGSYAPGLREGRRRAVLDPELRSRLEFGDLQGEDRAGPEQVRAGPSRQSGAGLKQIRDFPRMSLQWRAPGIIWAT